MTEQEQVNLAEMAADAIQAGNHDAARELLTELIASMPVEPSEVEEDVPPDAD